MNTLVLIDHDRGEVAETTWQALGFTRSLTDDPVAVVIGDGADRVVGPLGEHGVRRAITVSHPGLTDYAPEAWADALAAIVDAKQPEVVLGAGSERGNEVLAHLAAILDIAFAANVTEVSTESWELVRVRWGGSLLERAVLTSQLKLMSVAPHTHAAGQPNPVDCEVETFETEIAEEAFRTRVVERVKLAEGTTLATASVVVAGGRGVGSADAFGPLDELAELLGGAVGCSRVVTNSGWRPHSDQVGQTGTRVAPDLYIACGISGAIQHWVGMMASKNILAINTDPEAPMVTKADWAVIGDLHEVVPAIVSEAKQRSGS